MLKVREYVRSHVPQTPLMKGPLLVICHFQIPVPQRVKWLKRKKDHLLPHIKKPDGDNLEKFLNDALNGIVWDDDSRITWLVRSKTLTQETEGCTTIVVTQLENDKPNYEMIINTIKEHIYIGTNETE